MAAATTTATVAAMAAVLPKLSALLLMQEEEGEDGRGFIVNGGARRDATFLRDEIQKLRLSMEKNSLGNSYLHKKQEEDASAQCPRSRKLRDLLSDIEDTLDGFVLHRRRATAAAPRRRVGLADKAVDLSATAMARRRFAAQLRGFRSRASRIEEFDPRWQHSYSDNNRNRTRRQAVTPTPPRPLTYDEIKTSRPLRGADAAGLAATMSRRRDEVAGHLLLAAVGEGEEDDERAARRPRVVSSSFFESTHPPFPFRIGNTRLVAICGSRGMGKTTLAREVCRAIGGHLDCLAWVSAPPRRDMNDVLCSILDQIEKPRGADADDGGRRDLLVGSIRECLQHKRYLVVLDGICSTEAWETIRGALPHNDLGSRVLVTTTCIEFATSCSSGNGGVYCIDYLNFGDSWTLFHRRLFGSDNTCYPTCAKVAYKIVEKCSGIPPAMATVSTLLAHKPCSWSLWMHVHNSIGEHRIWMDNVVTSILSLAYHNLPRHLKLCLWHLVVFPADHPIDHGRVIRSWMAEGLVLEKPGKTAEEVAQSYLDELMDWNMIQPDHGGRTKAYLISSLVLELIQSESVEGNFVTILDRKPVSALPSRIRRLSIVSTNGGHDIQASLFKRNNAIPASVNKSHIRSLYIFGSAGKKHTFKHLTFLWVLDLQGCRDLKNHDVEEIVTRLRDLRYLSIRDTPISEIPDQIDQLQHLMTLDLRGTRVQELPASVLQLQRLTHLLCDLFVAFDVSEVEKLGNLSEKRIR